MGPGFGSCSSKDNSIFFYLPRTGSFRIRVQWYPDPKLYYFSEGINIQEYRAALKNCHNVFEGKWFEN